jgi:hypothetical protein
MKKTVLLCLAIFLIASVSPVFAGTGQIRMQPALPIMLSSPATFSISVTTGTSYDPQILLVMTNACHEGLTGNVVVTWSGGGTVSFAKADFTSDDTNGDKVPPSGTTNGASYTVASCKDHLGVSDAIWWAYKPFLAGPITTTPTEFTITFSSTHPKMLVYALGKSDQTATDFDMKVPNTIPGFVVPELATLLLTLGSFGALGLYTVKRKKK